MNNEEDIKSILPLLGGGNEVNSEPGGEKSNVQIDENSGLESSSSENRKKLTNSTNIVLSFLKVF